MSRRILVTGGTRGIGAGIAQAFAATGDEVIATGATDAEVATATARAAGAASAGSPGRIEHRVLDVRDDAAVRAPVGGLFGGLGELDAVVNCAAIIQRGAELEPEAFARTVDINLAGTMRVCASARLRVCAAAWPLLAARRGAIVNTASMLSFFGGGLVPGYSASKGGVAQLTKSLAIACAADGIRVNAVAPGWIAADAGAAGRPARAGPIVTRTPRSAAGARPPTSPGRCCSCAARRRASSPASCCRWTAAT